MMFFNTAITTAAHAAEKPPVKLHLVLKTDSSVLNIRHFDKATLNAYKKLPEFNYREEQFSPSLWTRFWRWFWHLFDFSGSHGAKATGFLTLVLQFLKYLVIIIGLGAVIFIILKLIGIDASNLFRKRSRSVGLPFSESLENIHDIDFDGEIQKAVNLNNFRLAVRLLYLKCLKQLNDASLITWQPDKTNSTYINELINADQRDSFKNLTRQFEYVWYGEFSIDAKVFNQISLLFNSFKSNLK